MKIKIRVALRHVVMCGRYNDNKTYLIENNKMQRSKYNRTRNRTKHNFIETANGKFVNIVRVCVRVCYIWWRQIKTIFLPSVIVAHFGCVFQRCI